MPQKKLRPPLVIRRVVGQSMLPTLPPGKLIIARGWFRTVKPQHIVVINHEGKEKIKRVYEIRGNQLYVVGDNLGSSKDSRHFGWIDNSCIVAKVVSAKRLISSKTTMEQL